MTLGFRDTETPCPEAGNYFLEWVGSALLGIERALPHPACQAGSASLDDTQYEVLTIFSKYLVYYYLLHVGWCHHGYRRLTLCTTAS